MFEKSDQQFANAAQHKAVRRHLLASLLKQRKHCRVSRLVLSGSAGLQLLLLLLMTWFLPPPSSDMPGFLGFSLIGLGLALVSTVAGVVSETARFYALDTQIKVIRMMEVANGQAEAEPLLESFNP